MAGYFSTTMMVVALLALACVASAEDSAASEDLNTMSKEDLVKALSQARSELTQTKGHLKSVSVTAAAQLSCFWERSGATAEAQIAVCCRGEMCRYGLYCPFIRYTKKLGGAPCFSDADNNCVASCEAAGFPQGCDSLRNT